MSNKIVITIEVSTETYKRYSAACRRLEQAIEFRYLTINARRNYRRSAVILSAAMVLIALVGKG